MLTARHKNVILPRVKIYLATLGCKLNESELEAWSRRFARDGYEIVADPQQADLCVLNTCTVTHVAARKSRQLARQLARENPNARIVLTGCYASISPEEAKNLPNVALVVPNADKERLVALAGELLNDVRYQTTETGCRLPEAASGVLQTTESRIQKPEDARRSPVSGQLTDDNRLWSADGGPRASVSGPPVLRTRAFVKIQDGCNMSCTYCIIPLARGKEHSRPLQEIVAEVKTLVDAGYQEIILTGVQISVYEHNGDKAHGLRDLVAALLGETAVPRLRLTSIAPWDLDQSLLELWRDPRLCRHVHLSLQSGADTVLKRMRRAYTTAQYARAVELTREHIPNVGITTDVIVGFPGESDVEFEQSREFVEKMAFSRVHVFPYSAREGTVAARLPLHVGAPVKDARAKRMQAVADASARAFAQRFIGCTLPVLWESCIKDETKTDLVHPSSPIPHSWVWSGYTDNYIRVTALSDGDWHNRIVPARLAALDGDGVVGEIA